MGHDNSINVKSARSWCGFAGMTWRLHEEKLKATGQSDLSVGLKPTKTLSFTTTENGDVLTTLVVEYQNVISVVAEVKENLLLATQMEKGKFVTETDEVARRILCLNVDSGADKAQTPTKVANEQRESPEEFMENGASNAPKLSKIRAMELKAEGMAEYILSQYPGSMPADFY